MRVAPYARVLATLKLVSLATVATPAPPAPPPLPYPTPFLSLSTTVKDNVALNYAVESRIYPEDPSALYVTLRGGGMSKYNISTPSAPVLAGHWKGINECEGQDRLGDLMVVATLGDRPRSGLVLLNVSSQEPWPPTAQLSRINISLPGALHVKLYTAPATKRVYAIMTTGLTHEPSRNSVVAVDVTDPHSPREVAAIPTEAGCTEGVIIMVEADAAFIGSYCSNTVQMVSLAELGNGKLHAAGARTDLAYENMVSGFYNQSYSALNGGDNNGGGGMSTINSRNSSNKENANDIHLLFSATYTDPGGLIIFNASKQAPSANGSTIVPTEIARYISNETARANRVHLHSSGIAFLALEKSHGADARGGLAAIDVSDPAAPRLIEAIKTPSVDSRTYCVASTTETAVGDGEALDEKQRGVVYAFGATAVSMWVYTFPLS